MKPVQANDVPDLMDFCKSEGTFFTVGFNKRSNGEYKEMNCRGGVRKHLTGGSLPYNPDECNLAVVFDVKAGKYKTIPVDGIVLIRAHKEEYRVNE